MSCEGLDLNSTLNIFFRVNRQMNHDSTPYADLGAEFQPPLMFVNNEVCDIETETAPSHVDPGRKKRFAKIRQVLGWDTMTFVTYGEGHFTAVPLA